MTLKDLMNLSEYARHRKARGLSGGSTQAVLNAVNAGRIPFVMVGKNRMVNPIAADNAWSLNTDTTRLPMKYWDQAPPAPQEQTSCIAIAQADTLGLCFENATLVAGRLAYELSIEPMAALKLAAASVSLLCLATADALKCEHYEDIPVPSWVMPLFDGDTSSPDLTRAIEAVVFGADLLAQEDGDESATSFEP